MDQVKVKRALVSVTDKAGVVEFCRVLAEEFGVEIVSTGGTAKALEDGGVPVRPIDDLTGFPEMMDGRVKTLHPKVHGGLLARRSVPEHMAAAEEHGIGMIDMVVVNLYAFEATIAREGVSEQEAIENIDIGGPSMLRSAAKNFESVCVVTDPSSYELVLAEMRANDGATLAATRRAFAVEVFHTTSHYDNTIWQYLSGYGDTLFPEEVRLRLFKQQELRYGENPHQKAAFYAFADAAPGTLAMAEQLQGKELSYNNILDTDGAWTAVREFTESPACVIIKHANPCGSAVDADITTAYQKAWACDPISAFGGIIALNRTVPASVIEAVLANEQFVEVIIAPDYEPAALELLKQKENVRVLKTGADLRPTGGHYESRAVEGGMLIQQTDSVTEDPATFKVASKRQPTDNEMAQLLFAWRVAKSVKSNAILLAKDFAGVGVGAGQMNRVDAARIAVLKAEGRTEGAVCASDAFMPFPDSLEVCAEAGVTAVIQPGGSVRDEEVLEKADELGVAVVFTGHRHFRH